jgi:large subunit ribosomal protein L29
MAIGSKELTPIELDTYEDERLLDELKKAKEELFNLRFQSATGQLESHGRLRAVKRDIARVYTVIRERELGIRATPAPLEPAAKTKRATKKTDAVDTEVVDDAPVAEDATDEAPVATAAASAADDSEAAPVKAPSSKAKAKEAK